MQKGKQKMIGLHIEENMPDGCKECRFKAYKQGEWYCVASKSYIKDKYMEQRPIWCKLLKFAQAAPVEPEIEGGNTTYWYVCSECHGQIDTRDQYCRHCGGKVKWK